MSIFVNEQKLGASIVSEIKADPALVDQIVSSAVTALVKALVAEIPNIADQIAAAVAKHRAQQAVK